MTHIKRIDEFVDNQSTGKPKTKDDIFDLDKIPMEVLDKGWQRYHPYVFTIDHRNPLANRIIEAKTNYRKQISIIKDAILKTFPLDETQFIIKEGNNGLFAAILVALTDDNVDVIEQAMENKGFFRSQPTDENLLNDRKNRLWIDVRFEPKDPDDVTEEVHRKYKILFHLTPSIFEETIIQNGLTVSNNNPNYRYSESRVFFSKGDSSKEDIQQLVNTLFTQAQNRNTPNISPKYTLFSFDLEKMNSDIRFYYDINEPKGLYTKVSIPSMYIVDIQHITAESNDKLP